MIYIKINPEIFVYLTENEYLCSMMIKGDYLIILTPASLAKLKTIIDENVGTTT